MGSWACASQGGCAVRVVLRVRLGFAAVWIAMLLQLYPIAGRAPLSGIQA